MASSSKPSTTYRYEKLSWPEIDAAAQEETLLVIPTACVEDHGHHLPIDVDIEIVTAIANKTAQQRSDTLVYPTVDNGYDPHHMHFPGTVTLHHETFIDTLIDIGVSLAHHGFVKLLFLNGHGSNHHLVHQATRQIIIQRPDVHAAMLSWWEMDEVHETIDEIGDGGPEGSGHAGEMETSLYRYLHPDAVDMQQAVQETGYPASKHFHGFSEAFTGIRPPGKSTPVTMMEWWSTFSEYGVLGDATVATEEKGEQLLVAAVAGLTSILDDYRELPIRDPTDHHTGGRDDASFAPFRPR